MKTSFIKTAFTAALTLATAFTLSCSGSGGDPVDNNGNANGSSVESSSSNDESSSSQLQDGISSSETPSSSDDGSSSSIEDSVAVSSSSSDGTIRKAKISGVFQKGPFIAGTTATLNELDNALNPTGRPYQTLITDDKGTFELRNVELVSPYAHLIASGFYRNEVTGNKSAAPITLQAIVDLRDRDNVNVNILTHLEYYRVLDLVDGGMTVKAAKKQAQKEIFAVFGIDSDSFKDSEDMTVFGTSESDAALLAVSILLLGDLSEADFSQRLMDFAQGLRTNGNWDNEAEKDKIADWAARANLESIKRNILAWGLSSAVPDFNKIVNDYWLVNYGLGVCDAGLRDSIKKSNKGVDYICKNNAWVIATEYEIDTYQWQWVCTEGEIKDGQASGKKYICKNNAWVIASSSEIKYTLACSVINSPLTINPKNIGYSSTEIAGFVKIECKEKSSGISKEINAKTDVNWEDAPRWAAPIAGTYDNIKITIYDDVDSCANMKASCTGILTITAL